MKKTMEKPVCLDCVHYESKEAYAKRTGYKVYELESTGGCNWNNVVQPIYHPVSSGCGQHQDFPVYLKWFMKNKRNGR
jgi:hypothetical protein